MGSILGCRSAALAVAAFMSLSRSPFLNIDMRPRTLQTLIPETVEKSLEIKDDEKEDNRKRNICAERSNIFKVVGNSDHALIASIFLKWAATESDQGRGSGKRYCEKLGLSYVGMHDMKQLVSQYDSSLVSIGFVPDSSSDANTKSWRVVRSCIVAALSPNQLIR
jgi:HrpA-like RNA helicase